MINKISGLIHWYKTSATLIGIPVLAYLIFLGVIGCVSEVSCKVLGTACQFSFTGSTDAAIRNLSREIDNNGDIVARPRK